MVLPPVTPRPNQLPLNDPNWRWDLFEAFCLDLISQFAEVKDCHRYGRQGDFQRGIDIFADLDNGERWVFQCKRYKRYTPGQTQKAIQEATYRANQYILLLSCEATSKVRDEVDKYPNWDVWDVEDISLKVRNLPLDVARRLVQDRFSSEWRKAFLGLAGLTTFVSSTNFFRELLNPDNRFNHTWSLVGRTELTEKLHEFVESNEQRLFILTGRGGIGKTKLLHAFSEEFDNRHQNVVLRFSAAPITPESLDELPIEPCVVVVDDANQQEGLEFLLAFARQNSQRIKLVLSCRLQSINQLRSVFDYGEIKPSLELENLKLEEVKQLARQALGNEYVHFAEQLAALTRDCPLFTVIGGRLLADKQVDPQLLERDKDFQDYLLTKFRDVLIGQVSNEIERDLCKRLLELIAAVAPIGLSNEKFKQVAAEFLKIEPSKFVSSRGILEQSGLLLRRGDTLRITPDILADHILYQRCLTPQGEPTGYAQEVFEKFKPVCPTQILRNLAELDWRIRHTNSEETDSLADIWQSIWEEFGKASNFDRCQLLDLLEEVAYHQPERTLELVEFVMRNPTTTPEDESLARIHRYTHVDVLAKLPRLLKRVGYTLNYLPYCCDLLWKLGRDDERNLNSHPVHAIRVLTELAEYDFDKPLEFNRIVLEAVSRWLGQPDVHNHIHSPLDVLDPLLEKSVQSMRVSSRAISLRPFGVSREKTLSIRQQVLQLITDCTTSDELDILLRAVKSLENALQEPTGYGRREITLEEREQWIPEQLKVLELISNLATQTTNPVVHLKIIESLDWYACYSKSLVVKQKVREIVTSIPNSYNLRLIRVLKPSYEPDWLLENQEDIDNPAQRREQRRKEMESTVVEEFLQRHPEASEGVQNLNYWLQAIERSDTQANPWCFLRELSKVAPSYATEMCEAILETSDSLLAAHFAALLWGVRITDVNRASAIAHLAVDTGRPDLCRSIAKEYWAWMGNLQLADIELLKKLLANPDPEVKKLAIERLGILGRLQPQQAIAMALAMDIGNSTTQASELCKVFDTEFGVPPDALTDNELKTLLTKLEPVKSLEDCGEFLAYASKRQPRSVVQMLLNRIERGREAPDGYHPFVSSYEPLPSGGFHYELNGLADSEEYEDILRSIRDQTLEREWKTISWFSTLYDVVSLGFIPASLKVLNEWIDSGDAEKIKAASRLVPPGFVFTYVEFVTNLLEQAYAAGDECYRIVSSCLQCDATSGLRIGISGEAFPQDIALQEQASAIAARFIKGSHLYRFYHSIAEYAKANVQEQLTLEEELD